MVLQEISPWGWQAYDAEFRERMQVTDCQFWLFRQSFSLGQRQGREEAVCHEWSAQQWCRAPGPSNLS